MDLMSTLEEKIIESLGKEMQAAMDYEIINDDKHPVPCKNITNDQWNWLCNTIGTPRKDWHYNFAHIWFLREEHKTLWLLRWA
jgi:hypothetical protein